MGIDLLIAVATDLEGARLAGRLPPASRVVRTGVGAVNAAHAVTRVLARERVGRIVVCGVGGAYPGSGLQVGDVACAASECYGDLGAASPDGFLDMAALGLPLVAGAEPRYNVFPMEIFPAARRVPFVTVSTCTGTDESARAVEARTGGAVESMEGAAVAHVAHLHGVPVGEIRGISNRAGDRDRAAWRLDEAAAAAQEAFIEWLAHA